MHQSKPLDFVQTLISTTIMLSAAANEHTFHDYINVHPFYLNCFRNVLDSIGFQLISIVS